MSHERRQKVSIEQLAEYHKWSYRHSKYERSLVSVAVNWLTILPSQGTTTRPESGAGSWAGTHVLFVGDDDGHSPQQDFPWVPKSLFRHTRDYEDITASTLVGLCGSADGEQIIEWIVDICADGRRRNAARLRKLVLHIVASLECPSLLVALNRRFGEAGLQALSEVNQLEQNKPW